MKKLIFSLLFSLFAIVNYSSAQCGWDADLKVNFVQTVDVYKGKFTFDPLAGATSYTIGVCQIRFTSDTSATGIQLHRSGCGSSISYNVTTTSPEITQMTPGQTYAVCVYAYKPDYSMAGSRTQLFTVPGTAVYCNTIGCAERCIQASGSGCYTPPVPIPVTPSKKK